MGGASAASSTSSTPPSMSRSIGSFAAIAYGQATSPAGAGTQQLQQQQTDAYASLNRRQPAPSVPNTRQPQQQQQPSQAPYAPLPGSRPAIANSANASLTAAPHRQDRTRPSGGGT